MKDPETVKRIQELSRAETAMAIARAALTHATEAIRLVVADDHPIAQALAECRLCIAKADTLNTQLLKRFSR